MAAPGSLNFLQGGGDMGERIRAFDWARHPMGPPEGWPPALRMALGLGLNSSFPAAIYWGPDFHLLYNDAWAEIPAEKHPWILGRRARAPSRCSPCCAAARCAGAGNARTASGVLAAPAAT